LLALKRRLASGGSDRAVEITGQPVAGLKALESGLTRTAWPACVAIVRAVGTMVATAALLGIGLQEVLMEKQRVGEALDSFRRYAQAFPSLDAKAVAQHFYEPSLLITPHAVAVLRPVAEVYKAYVRIMADSPTRRYAGNRLLEPT
jgi:hypothetical protein